MKHRGSSNYNPQSNGRAEVAVKKAKRLLTSNTGPNGSLDNDKFLRAMLQLRNTPDPDCNISPAEIVFGRNLRDSLAFVNRLEKFRNPAVRPAWREAWAAKEDALKVRFSKTAEKINEHARKLPPLRVGDRVFIQNQCGQFANKWDKSGVVVEVGQFDQYYVKVDGSGRVTKRNRRYLRSYTPVSPYISKQNAGKSEHPRRESLIAERVVSKPRAVEHVPASFPTGPVSVPPPKAPLPVANAPDTGTLPAPSLLDAPPDMYPSSLQDQPLQRDIPDPPVPPPSVESRERPRRVVKQTKFYDASSGQWT